MPLLPTRAAPIRTVNSVAHGCQPVATAHGLQQPLPPSGSQTAMPDLLDFIPCVADFPRPGVVFRDICPLLADPRAFAQALDRMEELTADWKVDHLAGIDARGLIFAAALSVRLGR